MSARTIYSLVLAAAIALCCTTMCEAAANRDGGNKAQADAYTICQERLPLPMQGEDLQWASNLTRYYHKYTDQISFLRLSNLLAGGPESKQTVAEARCLFESACLIGEFKGGRSYVKGCNGAQVNFDWKANAEGVVDTALAYQDGTIAYKITSVPALTDRRSYAVYINCLEDGTNGFTVVSTVPALSAQARSVIKAFLEKSGFADNFRIVTGFLAATCKTRI